MIDCKNDMILLDYPFESSTELIIRIMDLTGRQVYEGKNRLMAEVMLCQSVNSIVR